MNWIVLIILIIIILILISLGIYIYYRHKNGKSILPYSPINEHVQGYSNLEDNYEHPFIIKNFINKEKCGEIMNNTQSKLFDSEVISGKNKAIRNSQQCWVSKYDPMVKSMFQKISQQFNIPIQNAEDLQVVRYLPGQYYNEHHDACCDNNDKCNEFISRGGQRCLTVLIYLNNEFEGGHTFFKNLGLKVKPETGDAIVFYPLAKNTSKCHPLSLHAGMPVTNGEKWIANLWFRERSFRN
ncbi:4-hydroxylase [Moumouvirus goulette]|uniref:4-hydroxylase n=1 Tax=Moumouvirus goulette TaxID=1247379 RepID=M1PMD0_9VIRU|nr:4-hydroxylase [Moumouvirus goulette]AGF85101.1 4-hydroxylase [Moumouvirus goulette]